MKLKQRETANLILFQSEDKDLLKDITLQGKGKFNTPPGVKTIDLGEVDVNGLQENWKQAIQGVKKRDNLALFFSVNSKYFRIYVKDKKNSKSFDGY